MAKHTEASTLHNNWLRVRADWGHSESPITYSVKFSDWEEWQPTPFQVADFSHDKSSAWIGVQRWLNNRG